MGGRLSLLLACTVLSLALLASGTEAYSFYAKMNKLVYASNDTFIVTGNITNHMNILNMSVMISNSTPIVLHNDSWNGSGSNIFEFGYWFSEMPAGQYDVTVSDGTDSLILGIEVVSAITYLEAHLVNLQDVVSVATNTTVTTGNAMGGNFTELINLSISGTRA
jgi:hypothetical protein